MSSCIRITMLSCCCVVVVGLTTELFPRDDRGGDAAVSAGEKMDGDGLAAKITKSAKLKLTVQKVVEYLIKNNFDVKKAFLDYKGASSGLLAFDSRYDPVLSGAVDYAHSYNPDPSASIFQGKSSDGGRYTAGILKNFNSGTSLSVSVTGSVQDKSRAVSPGTAVIDPGTYLMFKNIGGIQYQTGITLQLTQELLKNSFGISERLTNKKLDNAARMTKEAVKLKLAGLLVDAVIGYWNVAIAEENLKTSQENLRSTAGIRDLIARKTKLGLSESDEILDWEGKVLQGRNNRERADKLLFDAKLAVLRSLNLDSSTEIEIGTTFQTEPPAVTYEQALRDAFIKRVDWNIQKAMIANAELEYRIAFNERFPSLKLKLGAGSSDFSKKSYADAMNSINPGFSAGLEMTYPLGNTAADVRLRDARLGCVRENINLESLEKQIRDELVSIVKQCELDYAVYRRTKQARGYAQDYYRQVQAKFQLGRYSALQIKLALDGYIVARYAELQSLVNYNISLIRRDFSRNVIFENLGIDVNGILRRVEN